MKQESPFNIPYLDPFIPDPLAIEIPHFNVHSSEIAGTIINNLVLKATEMCIDCEELAAVVWQFRQAHYPAGEMDVILSKLDSILMKNIYASLIQPDLLDRLGRIYVGCSFGLDVMALPTFDRPFDQLSLHEKVKFVAWIWNSTVFKSELLFESLTERVSALSDFAKTKSELLDELTRLRTIARIYFKILGTAFNAALGWLIIFIYRGDYERASLLVLYLANHEAAKLLFLFLARVLFTAAECLCSAYFKAFRK